MIVKDTQWYFMNDSVRFCFFGTFEDLENVQINFLLLKYACMKYQWTPNCHWRTISNHYKMFYCIYFRRNSSFSYDLWYHINSSGINFLFCYKLLFLSHTSCIIVNNIQVLLLKTKSFHRCDFNEVTIFLNIFTNVKHGNISNWICCSIKLQIYLQRKSIP